MIQFSYFVVSYFGFRCELFCLFCCYFSLATTVPAHNLPPNVHPLMVSALEEGKWKLLSIPCPLPTCHWRAPKGTLIHHAEFHARKDSKDGYVQRLHTG